MKRSIYFIFITFMVVHLTVAQNVKDVDFISAMHNDMAAVKKGSQWGFINSKGQMVVNFRDDLFVTTNKNGNYPVFEDGRCLIIQKKDGINYFGYIDTSGKTVIEPDYLNATNFDNNLAIVLLLKRTELSPNSALNKPVVSYDYHEVVIDISGKVVTYLSEEPTHINLSPTTIKKSPPIYAKFISATMLAVMNSQKKWSVVMLPSNN